MYLAIFNVNKKKKSQGATKNPPSCLGKHSISFFQFLKAHIKGKIDFLYI